MKTQSACKTHVTKQTDSSASDTFHKYRRSVAIATVRCGAHHSVMRLQAAVVTVLLERVTVTCGELSHFVLSSLSDTNQCGCSVLSIAVAISEVAVRGLVHPLAGTGCDEGKLKYWEKNIIQRGW